MDERVRGADELQRRSFERANAVTREGFPEERRLTGDRLRTFLAEHRYAVIASTRADGRAHATPGSYVVTDGPTFWLPTSGGAQRLRNVQENGWVSLVIDEGERGEHALVLSEGRARLESAPTSEVADLWTARWGGLPGWAEAWIVVEPERLFTHVAEGSRWA